MDAFAPAVPGKPTLVSPLLLADRLITLAQEADRAGYTGAAGHMMTAMYKVLGSRKRAGR